MSSSNIHLWVGGRSKHYGEFIMSLQDEHFNCRAVTQKLPDLLTALKSMGANDAKLTDIGKRIIDKVQKNFDIYDTVMTKYGINAMNFTDRYRFFQVESLLDYLYYDFPNEMQELKAECKIDMLAAMIKPLYKIDNPDGKTKADNLVNSLKSSSTQLEKCSTILSQWFNKIYQQIHQKMKDICSNSVCNFNGKELKSLSDILEKIDLFMNDMLRDVELENKIYADIIVHLPINHVKCDDRQNVVELIEEDSYLLHQFVDILHLLLSNKFCATPYDKSFHNQLENIQSSDLKLSLTDNKSSEVKQICGQKDVAIPTFVTTPLKNISDAKSSIAISTVENSQCCERSSTLSVGSAVTFISFASSECSPNSMMSSSSPSIIMNDQCCEKSSTLGF